MSYPPPPGPEDPNGPQNPPPPNPYGATPPPPPPPPPVYGTPPGYPVAPGYAYAMPQANQKALWAMILGILGLLCCGIASVVAVVLGNQAKAEIQASNGAQSGAGQAQAGFVLGIIGCALWVLGIAVYVIILVAAGSSSGY